MLVIGAVYVAAQTPQTPSITIPTSWADHRTTLVELFIGEQKAKGDPIKLGNNNEVIIPVGLIAGMVKEGSGWNQVENSANATIGGGGDGNLFNLIQNGDNSLIAAGIGNKILAPNSVIGAGLQNEIDWWNSFIGGGYQNKVSSQFSTIAGWYRNVISADYSVIPGGSNNTIEAGADFSFVAGEAARAKDSGTFIWSDYDEAEYMKLWSPWRATQGKIQSTKPNTFLIRAQNGMLINTNTAIAGVNVNIGWPAKIGGEGLLSKPCSGEHGKQYSGTYEMYDWCMYFCDGKFWQLLNVETPSNVARCGVGSEHAANIAYTKCTLYNPWDPYFMDFRAGDSVTAYQSSQSNNRNTAANACNNGALITCQQDGTRSPAGYEHINCTRTN